PADGAGQEAQGGGCPAWTGRSGGPRPSGRPHASPVVWPAAARTSTNSYGRNCGEPQQRDRAPRNPSKVAARKKSSLLFDFATDRNRESRLLRGDIQSSLDRVIQLT